MSATDDQGDPAAAGCSFVDSPVLVTRIACRDDSHHGGGCEVTERANSVLTLYALNRLGIPIQSCASRAKEGI